MTVVLVGVGADSGNVRPRPTLGPGGRFEYIPIPEKSRATAESRTFGSIQQRTGEGSLADLLEGIRPHGNAAWRTDDETIRGWPVHYDPNFSALTYGEGGKDQNARAIEANLAEGDILGFYTGLDTGGRMHRYLFGYFTVAGAPVVVDEDTDEQRRRAVLRSHDANAHAKRSEANGSLYAFDPERPQGASRVVLVDGRAPGGLLDRAVRLSDPVTAGHFYMADDVASALDPDTTYLGGFKPPVVCDISATAFVEFLERHR
jgi:hypothetical protein